MSRASLPKQYIDDLPPELRGHVAENMKERIYSAITLLAVVTTLWTHSAALTTRAAIGSILGSVVALWLATLVATRISYRAVYAREMTLKEYRSTMFASSGLLAPAIAPTGLLLASSLGIVTLHDALGLSILVLLASMLYFSFVAGRKIYERRWQVFLVSSIEMVIGLLIVGLKLVLGK